MTELQADLRLAVGMDEIRDPAPCRAMLVVPHARATGRNAARWRYAGHFREDQPGAALGARSQVDEVEIVRRSVGCRIGRHRRDDDAVGERHLAKPEGCEHRRCGLWLASRTLPEAGLRPFEPALVAKPQVFVTDALGTGEERIGELPRLEVEITLDRLEPFGRVSSAVLKLQDLEVPFRLIFGK